MEAFFVVLSLSLAGAASGIVVLLGARAMPLFRRYHLCVLAAALAMLSFPVVYTGVLTIPVGAWALVILLRPRVRARFDVVRQSSASVTEPERGR
jgi:hypothetical protein